MRVFDMSKGSRRRPSLVPDDEVQAQWDRAFGSKPAIENSWKEYRGGYIPPTQDEVDEDEENNE